MSTEDTAQAAAKRAVKQTGHAAKNVSKAAKLVSAPVVEEIEHVAEEAIQEVSKISSAWQSNRRGLAFFATGAAAGYFAWPLVKRVRERNMEDEDPNRIGSDNGAHHLPTSQSSAV